MAVPEPGTVDVVALTINPEMEMSPMTIAPYGLPITGENWGKLGTDESVPASVMARRHGDHDASSLLTGQCIATLLIGTSGRSRPSPAPPPKTRGAEKGYSGGFSSW